MNVELYRRKISARKKKEKKLLMQIEIILIKNRITERTNSLDRYNSRLHTAENEMSEVPELAEWLKWQRACEALSSNTSAANEYINNSPNDLNTSTENKAEGLLGIVLQ
jgi:methionyl-tRNA synthetase